MVYLFLVDYTLLWHSIVNAKADIRCGYAEVDERGLMTTRATDNSGMSQVHRAEVRDSTETKSSYKTTELIAYVVAVAGVLIAALLTDGGADGFNTVDAWRFVTYLTIGYMISRGLAKAGSRESYRD